MSMLGQKIQATQEVVNTWKRDIAADLGFMRFRQDNYPEIIRIGSINSTMEVGTLGTGSFGNSETNKVSIGMAFASGFNRFYKPTTSGTFYIASSSANDTSAGTGAQNVFIRGLVETSSGIYEEMSETLSLNGNTSVATSLSNWYRINIMVVGDTGTTRKNEGDIYVSSSNSFTAGVPNTDTIISCILLGRSLSTMGDYSVGTYQVFAFTKGNFFTRANNTDSKIMEEYEQPFGETIYYVAHYTPGSTTYDYTGSGSYTADTDVRLDIFDTSGGSNVISYMSYFIEYMLLDNRLINSSPINFAQT